MGIILEESSVFVLFLLVITLFCFWGYAMVVYRMIQAEVSLVGVGITVVWCVAEYIIIECLMFQVDKSAKDCLENADSLPMKFAELPTILVVGITVASVVVFLVLMVWLYFKRKNQITQMSIKESMDTLPMGICYYLDTGLIRLINHSMQQISQQLTGRHMDNGVMFREMLMDRKIDVPIQQSGDDIIVALEDGRMMQFQFSEFIMDKTLVYEMIAFDITEIYRLNLALEQENNRQKVLNERLKKNNENIKYITIQKEELDAKIRIHDNLGQIGLMAKNYLKNGGSQHQRQQLISAWKENLQFLEHYGMPVNKDMYERLLETAVHVGVTVKVQGQLPKEEKAKNIVLSAMHECLTNTIRHGKADELYVTIIQDNKNIKVIFTNNGLVPKEKIQETGGLKLLRQKVEQAGGIMQVDSLPKFQVMIQLRTEGKGGE